MGFTGYCLVFEELSYWGATVGSNLMDQVPGGHLLKQMLLAGEDYNEQTLPRFYILHAAIMPVMIVLLIAVHIMIIRLHGITELEQTGAAQDDQQGYFNFFPDHILTELAMGLVLMILLSALATLFPATLGAKADPLTTPEVIKPEWFFYATFCWLKLFGPTFAVLSMGLIFFVMFIWPWIDSLLVRMTRNKDITSIKALAYGCRLFVKNAATQHSL
jgi:quinol-cytochrome oxidoreductase complex cytochrome b subunit